MTQRYGYDEASGCVTLLPRGFQEEGDFGGGVVPAGLFPEDIPAVVAKISSGGGAAAAAACRAIG